MLVTPFKIYLNTDSTAVIVTDNADVLLKTVPRNQISIQNSGSLDRIRVFLNDSDSYLFSDILNAAGATYGANRDLAAKELSNLSGFNLGGGGGGSVNSVTASAPLTSSGGANPNITLQNPGDGNWALNFSGGAATFIPIQGETVGSYKAFATTAIPVNYLFCNGAIVNIATYPDLFAVIGNDYGGDGITTFGIPDYRGRFIKGDSGADIATSNGSNNLSIGQLPIINASGTIQVSTSDANSPAANGSYFANGIETGNGANVLSFLPNGSQGTTVNVAGVSLNAFGSNQPHEHPNLVARIAICFESVGISGASPTPSFNAVLGVSNNSNIRALFNGIPYVALNEIPNFLTETSTIANFVTGQTFYYIGETAITYDYNTLPYPLPIPVQNFNFVNLSVHNVLFTSDSGNYSYTLKPLQALKDITIIDGGVWQVLATEYIDNIYTLQQVTTKGNTTTDAIIVRNNPDTYRVRYSTIGQQIQKDDLGNRINYDHLGINLNRTAGNKNWALQIPDITANPNNSSFVVVFRPNISGTVAYLSDINVITEQTHTTGATITIADNTTILYVNPATFLAALAITLPANPINGQEVKVSFGGAITIGTVVTALTIVGNGLQTVLAGASITNAIAGDGYIFKYQSSLNLWRLF
jgi:microcystin-dependent protein